MKKYIITILLTSTICYVSFYLINQSKIKQMKQDYLYLESQYKQHTKYIKEKDIRLAQINAELNKKNILINDIENKISLNQMGLNEYKKKYYTLKSDKSAELYIKKLELQLTLKDEQIENLVQKIRLYSQNLQVMTEKYDSAENFLSEYRSKYHKLYVSKTKIHRLSLGIGYSVNHKGSAGVSIGIYLNLKSI